MRGEIQRMKRKRLKAAAQEDKEDKEEKEKKRRKKKKEKQKKKKKKGNVDNGEFRTLMRATRIDEISLEGHVAERALQELARHRTQARRRHGGASCFAMMKHLSPHGSISSELEARFSKMSKALSRKSAKSRGISSGKFEMVSKGNVVDDAAWLIYVCNGDATEETMLPFDEKKTASGALLFIDKKCSAATLRAVKALPEEVFFAVLFSPTTFPILRQRTEFQFQYFVSSATDRSIWAFGGFASDAEGADFQKRVVREAARRKAEGKNFATITQSVTEAESMALGLATERRLAHLFPEWPAHKRKKLMLDAEAVYSVTDEATADKISHMIMDDLGDDESVESATIVDATACVGGNVLSFAKVFRRVVAIEIDEGRFHMLKNNLEVAQVSRRVFPIHGNCIEKICAMRHRAACVFIDPPWGGLEYKNKETVELRLGSLSLLEACRKMQKTARRFCLKLPFNASTRDLESEYTVLRKERLNKSTQVILLQTF
eukprot:g3187.t1